MSDRKPEVPFAAMLAVLEYYESHGGRTWLDQAPAEHEAACELLEALDGIAHFYRCEYGCPERVHIEIPDWDEVKKAIANCRAASKGPGNGRLSRHRRQ